MPSKNIVKAYIENGYYHIYNRGVEKRKIFIDEQDYRVFLSYLKIYLLPKIDSTNEIVSNKNGVDEDQDKTISEIYKLNNFFNKIDLISYVLMPNHFHLELKQKNRKEIEFFMRSLITKYSKYFNKKYERVGPLFQSRYKAVLIQNTELLLYLSRYIHRNPEELLVKGQSLIEYPWSSYPTYLNKINISWLKTHFIGNNFLENGIFSADLYKNFVENGEEQTKEDIKTYKRQLLD
ncbi:MAG: transposase [Patescibacteria group bacterium]